MAAIMGAKARLGHGGDHKAEKEAAEMKKRKTVTSESFDRQVADKMGPFFGEVFLPALTAPRRGGPVVRGCEAGGEDPGHMGGEDHRRAVPGACRGPAQAGAMTSWPAWGVRLRVSQGEGDPLVGEPVLLHRPGPPAEADHPMTALECDGPTWRGKRAAMIPPWRSVSFTGGGVTPRGKGRMGKAGHLRSVHPGLTSINRPPRGIVFNATSVAEKAATRARTRRCPLLRDRRGGPGSRRSGTWRRRDGGSRWSSRSRCGRPSGLESDGHSGTLPQLQGRSIGARRGPAVG